MMRANLRRAHFEQIFEENLHYYLLNQKLVAKDNQKKFEIKHGLYATRKQNVDDSLHESILEAPAEDEREEEKEEEGSFIPEGSYNPESSPEALKE